MTGLSRRRSSPRVAATPSATMSARPRATTSRPRTTSTRSSCAKPKLGKRVVRLKSGDPLIFGRAGEEMAALRAAGVSFDIVPGITAAFAAAAETEIPLTLRDRSSALVFVTGHDADGETLPGWAGLALTGATVAVYMGRSVAAKVATRLIEAGLAGSTPVAVLENASRPDRRAYAGRLDELAALAARTEFGRTGPLHRRRGCRRRRHRRGARRALRTGRVRKRCSRQPAPVRRRRSRQTA